MPRINQIVGRLIQVAAIASVPTCCGLIGSYNLSLPYYYIGENAPEEYKELIGKSERVQAIQKLRSIADHTGPDALKAIIKENAVREIKGLAKLPLPPESRLTGGADYCKLHPLFVGSEIFVSCYASIGDKIENRIYSDFGCAKYSENSCKIKVSTDEKIAADYQQASNIDQELYKDSVHEESIIVSIVIAFTSPLWLFVGGWISKNKGKDIGSLQG